MKNPVRIGLVGAGFAAHFHLASYEKVYGHDFEVRAIASRSRDKAAKLAADFGVPVVHDDIDALIADPDIDVVDIVVPNHLHAPLILKVAAAGKHVFCEKPLTGYYGPPDAAPGTWTADGVSRETILEAALEQANLLYDAITAAGVTFCYGENWVYAPPVVKARRLLEVSDSTVLRIVGEESHSGSHAEYAKRWQSAGGGSLVRLSVHPLGAALHLKYEEGRRRAGTPIRAAAVSAEVANLTRIESFAAESPRHVKTGWADVEDFGTMHVTFEDGSVAQITSTDTVMGGIYNYLHVFGSRVVAKAHINPNDACMAYTPDGRYLADEYLVEKTETKEGWSFPSPDEDAVTGFPAELRDFVGAVAEGRPPLSDITLAHDVMVVVHAAYLSAETGRRVDVTPLLRR